MLINGVSFVSETHQYSVEGGREIPSLTQMLDADGLNDHLHNVPDKVKAVIAAKSEWGTDLHLALLRVEYGYGVDANYKQHCCNWLDAIRKMGWAKVGTDPIWQNAEMPVLGKYGGLIWGMTPDRAHPKAVVEIKGTYAPHISHSIQTALQVMGMGYDRQTPRYVAYFDKTGMKRLHLCSDTIKRYNTTVNVWDEAERILFDHAAPEAE